MKCLNCIFTTCAAQWVCQSKAKREQRKTREEEENLPQGGYRRARDNMAKAAGRLEEHGQLPRVVWQTSADTALHCGSHTSFFWLRLTGLCAETSSLRLMHVNSAHRLRSDADRHDNALTKPICTHIYIK